MPYPPLTTFLPQLCAAAIDPASAVYLPLVVLDQTLPLEPLAATGTYSGDVNAFGAGLADLLWAAAGNSGSGATGQITLDTIQVIGTSNVLPQQPAISGNAVTLTFLFGGVTSTSPLLPVPATLQFVANVNIALSCGSNTAQVSGTVAATFTGASLVLATTMDSSYDTSVQSAVFAAGSLGVVSGSVGMFQISEPPSRATAVATVLNTAFAQAAAVTPLVQYANQCLAAGNVLTKLASELTIGLQSLANPQLLSFVASLLYKAGVNPSGTYYLPQQITAATDPQLDPYAAGGWNLGDVSNYFSGAGSTICSAVLGSQQPSEAGIQTPGTAVPVKLANIDIAGLSNVLPCPLLTVGNTIVASCAFNVVTGWPRTFNLTGSFTLDVSCCPTVDFDTCSGPSEPSTGTGTFVATIAKAGISAMIAISAVGNELVATLEALNFRTDPNLTDPQNIVFTIDINSVPEAQRAIWNQQAENLFNSPDAAASIVKQIQGQMNEPNVLAQISTMITNAIQGVLGAHEDRDLGRRLVAEIAALEDAARHRKRRDRKELA